MPLSSIDSPFFRRLILKHNSCAYFPSRLQLMNEKLLRLIKKTKKKFIYEVLETCDICMVSFDSWMLRGLDTFVLIIHLLDHNWESGHVIIGLSEITKTFGIAMAIQVNEVLTTYGFNVKILAYVKDEGNNLSTMTTTLIFIVFYKVLGLTTPFIGSYWGHAMSKCY